MNLEELVASDRQHVFHSSTHLQQHARGETPVRVVTRAEGIYIEDAEGHRLLDAFAGLYCVNVGYGRQEIAEAIYAQAQQLAYYHTYVGHTNEPLVRLSQRIVGLAGQDMSRVYYGLSGSDANETQLKLVWYYNNVLGRPEKKKVISRDRGYHGSSIASGSMTGLPVFHAQFDLPLERIKHTIAPSYYRRPDAAMTEQEFSRYCAEQLEQLILAEGPETVAAMIAEPVLGTGGIIPPPEGYWAAIREVLDRYDILLIADEVVCGFGRIGVPFGSQYYAMRPDLITIAKGLTSAYQPLSGVIIGERVWSVLEQGTGDYGPIGHGYTYSGHALGAAAALANLDIIEREDLTGNAQRTGAYFQQRLQETFADHPMVGEVRGIGLLAALEFAQNPAQRQAFAPELKVGPRVASACLAEGLIARAMPHGDILGFAPPLIVTPADIDRIVGHTEQAVRSVMDALVREGHSLA